MTIVHSVYGYANVNSTWLKWPYHLTVAPISNDLCVKKIQKPTHTHTHTHSVESVTVSLVFKETHASKPAWGSEKANEIGKRKHTKTKLTGKHFKVLMTAIRHIHDRARAAKSLVFKTNNLNKVYKPY